MTIAFGRITDPTRQHQFFWAVPAADWNQFRAIYDADELLTIEPFQFTDPDIVAATEAWIDEGANDSNKLPAVMVGSIENGRWVNWNLTDVPKPPIPAGQANH